MDNFNKIYKFLLDFLLAICLVSVFGAAVYRIYSLNSRGVAISLVLAISSFFIIQYFKPTNKANRLEDAWKKIIASGAASGRKKEKLPQLFLFLAYLPSAALGFYVLFSSSTGKGIVSPWEAVPSYFFVVYAVSTLILIANIAKNEAAAVYLAIIHYFLSFSAALIVYRIGYGFDPFIHQATVDLINKTGSVDPKPFYYLGQYSLIVIFGKITSISTAWLDKLLVPVAAAVLLPAVIWQAARKIFSDSRTSLLAVLIFLIFPFSFFIVTTPQNFAYLLLLLVIALGLACNSLYDLSVIYVLSLAAVAFQPIAGLPALFFAMMLTVYHSDSQKIKKIGYAAISFLAAASLPAAFYFVEKSFAGAANINIDADNMLSALNIFAEIKIPATENFILNAVYLYGFNVKTVIAVFLIAGLAVAYRHKKSCAKFKIYLLMSLSLLLSYFATKSIPFNFLIEYERNNYADRLITISLFFLLPFFLVALYALAEKILISSKFVKYSFFSFLAVFITASFYLSYPRHDNYFNSRGFSTSQYDVEAVRWINEDANKDYIVLANQQVSAAALKEFGFSRYYHNDIFYYPIPTGGPLYQYYLDMVYKKPSQETILKAMELAGVETGYFVLNKYWWAFPKILDEAKFESRAWKEIGNGEVYIFKYEK